MSSNANLKPLIIWMGPGGPNPPKVTIVLEELGIPYSNNRLPLHTSVKEPFFLAKNPNGRAPALEDPNTGITLWESGAIIQYIIETYDKSNTLTHGPGTPEHHHENQWLQFQMSGQGPYYGQAFWFSVYHPEDVPSARDRYVKEARRVVGVLNSVLEKKEWLVGDKLTYADLSFYPWDSVLPFMFLKANKEAEWEEVKNENPHWWKWHQKIAARDSVKAMTAEKEEAEKKAEAEKKQAEATKA